jgi:hypothetical protein
VINHHQQMAILVKNIHIFFSFMFAPFVFFYFNKFELERVKKNILEDYRIRKEISQP